MGNNEILNEQMVAVGELVTKLRNSIRDSEAERCIFLELDSLLKTMIKPVMSDGKIEKSIPSIEGLSYDDIMITDNKYESIFIEDIASWVVDGDHYRISDEKFQKILYYMVDNNVRAYRQDW
jgi:hypothetical protein